LFVLRLIHRIAEVFLRLPSQDNGVRMIDRRHFALRRRSSRRSRATALHSAAARSTAVSEILEHRCLLAAAAPLLSIGDARVIEGTGTVSQAFVDVTLSSASEVPVTVNYTTQNRSALRARDYKVSAGTLKIAAGVQTGRIWINIISDSSDEPDETFEVVIKGAQAATISKATGIVTIVDDDLPPVVSVSNVSVVEGQAAEVKLSLSQPSAFPVTIRYRTVDVSAINKLDYVAAAGEFTIPAGATSTIVNMATLQDSVDESHEEFAFLFSTVDNTKAGDITTSSTKNRTKRALITIIDDDPPGLSVNHAIVTEGPLGVSVQLMIQASSTAAVPMSFAFRTRNGTAVYGADYRGNSGTVTIPAGSSSAVLKLKVLDDRIYEATEYFDVVLSNPVNATLLRPVGRVTLVDNDVPPVVSIANSVVTEGSLSSTVVVSLDTVSGAPVTVTYQTVQGTARPPFDYTDQSGTIIIPAGQTSATIPVMIRQDKLAEPDEAFKIVLSTPVDSKLGRAAAIVTIQDDDRIELPLFELSDMTYLGRFRIPTGQIGSSSFEFGGNALTFNPVSNSLFMAANINSGLHVAEVIIPAKLGGGPDRSPMVTARVQQPFVDLGALLSVSAAGQNKKPIIDYENLNLGGLLVADGGLTGAMYMGYNGAEPKNSKNSHFRASSLNLSAITAADLQGLMDIRRNKAATDARSRAGYMAEVPLAWRPYLGATYVTGAAGQNRIQFSSSGPALFGFNAVNPSASSSAPLLAYPAGHALDWSDSFADGPRPIFNGTTKVDGVAFVPGTRSVIFMGSSGQSNIGYGDGSLFNDKVRPYSGYHSQNGKYAYQIWSYDINDFMAVRNGMKNSWDLRPTNVFNFDLPTPEPTKYLGGIAFDPATSRLYVSQKQAGAGYTPVIHVYQLGRQTAPATSAVLRNSSGFTSVASSSVTSASTTHVTKTTISSGTTFTSVAVAASASNAPVAASTTDSEFSSSSTLKNTSSSSTTNTSQSSTSTTSASSRSLQSIDQLFGSLSLDLNVL